MTLQPGHEEALRRAGVVWVGLEDRPPKAVWHVWHDHAVLVVVGGSEQDLPGASTAVRGVVVVRPRGALSGRLADLPAAVSRLVPGSAAWETALPVLAAARLNATGTDGLAERWASESLVLRLDLPGAGGRTDG